MTRLLKTITVSFAEYSLFYRALLQKRPMFLGSLLIVAISLGHQIHVCIGLICRFLFRLWVLGFKGLI